MVWRASRPRFLITFLVFVAVSLGAIAVVVLSFGSRRGPQFASNRRVSATWRWSVSPTGDACSHARRSSAI